jgi:outer membrane protein OmpA-like peptidoglycan-associated protein
MVRLTRPAATAAVLALMAMILPGREALAQSVGKCSYNSIAQQWPNPTIVHFDTGKTAIHADDAKKIADLAKLAKDHYIQQICVSGFADKEGNAAANMKLSLARGQAVAKQLAQNGADPRTIMINPNGEPGGSFGGGSAQYANQADRRVEIRFTK